MAREPKCASERKYTFFIYALLRCQLEKAQFQLGLFAHHVLVPFGLKHQVDGGGGHAVYRFYLLADIFHDEVGGGGSWELSGSCR